eukprot:scaffold162991_cov33-Attheya_sp.AAC.1
MSANRNCVASRAAVKNIATKSSSSEITPLLHERDGVTKIWKRYRRWDQVAVKRKKALHKWSRVEKYLSSAGAALTTGASQVGDWGWAAAILGGAFLGAAPMIRKTFLGPDQVSARMRSRVV